jgi:hypothetical protein
MTDQHEPREIVMNPVRHIRRLAAALAGLAGALLAFDAAAPAALARPGLPRPWQLQHPPLRALPPGWNKHPPLPPRHLHQPVHTAVHTVVIGGMPGWQIALIAIAAGLFAATAAVLVYRAWAARRRPVPAAASTMRAEVVVPPGEKAPTGRRHPEPSQGSSH